LLSILLIAIPLITSSTATIESNENSGETNQIRISDVFLWNQYPVLTPETKIESPKKPIVLASFVAPVRVTLPNLDGYYAHPLNGIGTTSRRIHSNNGVDIIAKGGTPIYASASGIVSVAMYGYSGGYGNYVVITHENGTETLYAHMAKVVAVQASSVVQGELIGYVGSTGYSSGNHVHFEVHGALNPFRFIP